MEDHSLGWTYYVYNQANRFYWTHVHWTLYTVIIVHFSAGQPSTLFIQRHSRQLCGHLLGMLWLWSSRTTSSTWGASITRWKRSPTLVLWEKFIMGWLTGYTEEWWKIIIPDNFRLFSEKILKKTECLRFSPDGAYLVFLTLNDTQVWYSRAYRQKILKRVFLITHAFLSKMLLNRPPIIDPLFGGV